jgi:hypothetical protein
MSNKIKAKVMAMTDSSYGNLTVFLFQDKLFLLHTFTNSKGVKGEPRASQKLTALGRWS